MAKKALRGTVVSVAMDKSIVVKMEYSAQERTMHKIVRRSKRVVAHDEKNSAKVGDVVSIEETRPLSKRKHYRLVGVEAHQQVE